MLRLQISTSTLNVSSPLEHPCPQKAGRSFPHSLPLQKVLLKIRRSHRAVGKACPTWLGKKKIMQLLTNGLNQVKSVLEPGFLLSAHHQHLC